MGLLKDTNSEEKVPLQITWTVKKQMVTKKMKTLILVMEIIDEKKMRKIKNYY